MDIIKKNERKRKEQDLNKQSDKLHYPTFNQIIFPCVPFCFFFSRESLSALYSKPNQDYIKKKTREKEYMAYRECRSSLFKTMQCFILFACYQERSVYILVRIISLRDLNHIFTRIDCKFHEKSNIIQRILKKKETLKHFLQLYVES